MVSFLGYLFHNSGLAPSCQMGFIRFGNHSSVGALPSPAPPTSTDDDDDDDDGFSPSPSSSTTEIGLPASPSTQPFPTPTHSFTLTHTHAHHSFLYTHSFTHPYPFFDPPSSVSPTGLASPNNGHPHRVHSSEYNHKSSLVVIIFAAIGGTIALFFLAYFTRQAIAYSRLPRQSRELTATGRQELVQELVGYAHRRRQSCLAPPPPPYEHAPPYESFSPQQLDCADNPC